jgi:hypothetical protein
MMALFFSLRLTIYLQVGLVLILNGLAIISYLWLVKTVQI